MARCLLFHDWIVWLPVNMHRQAYRRCRRCNKWQAEVVDSLGAQWVRASGRPTACWMEPANAASPDDANDASNDRPSIGGKAATS